MVWPGFVAVADLIKDLIMKLSRFALALGIVMAGSFLARADAAAPPALSPAQMTAMHAKLSQAQKLINEIDQSYGTQFAIGPKMEMMAMSHMAKANMEMAKAMMEMQEMWTGTPSPSAYPSSLGGQ
ncbi:MAG: hypothetical protein B7Z58_03690 [Acidiphilium sp. 37-64-53]|uniref:hypothetical protein n=1 Tax=Acidiphilium TaxID=522 RepID=UPI000BC5EED3|nr:MULTISPECIES: hypothetical protein [Acidiphilium]OYW03412.1 MAG: hypothetical protein B7Z58_03690 [Acidiphilium sp. 37-64-53]OZB30737.1 MAG: hypothetical protein B7X49_01740 [Acidiphilium sp. 34-64-41]HQT84578.1 hypothetical protein [Acidiphilium rubrum]